MLNGSNSVSLWQNAKPEAARIFCAVQYEEPVTSCICKARRTVSDTQSGPCCKLGT